MTTTYAKGTKVPITQTRGEIENLLVKHGADGFGYATKGNQAAIQFEINGHQTRMTIPLPDQENFRITQGRVRRSEQQMQAAHEQACRETWQSMLLAIKAKLNNVAMGITTADDEFMAYIMLTDGTTVGEWLQPQIEESYRNRAMPPTLASKPIAPCPRTAPEATRLPKGPRNPSRGQPADVFPATFITMTILTTANWGVSTFRSSVPMPSGGGMIMPR